jgi:sec-independent protein translocase protein TatC
MAKKPTDDLFEKSTMSFGEHLEELRVCLFRGVAGIALGCVIGFFAANWVVRFFQSPLERAMEKYYLANAMQDIDKQYGENKLEVQRMILDEKLIPEALQVDVGRLADTLQMTFPEQVRGWEISPYAYTGGDFLEGGAKRLCQLLVANKDRADSSYSRCWQLLSEADRQVVQSVANASDSLPSEQQAQVLRVLNGLAGQRALHESAEFANLTGFDTDLVSSFATSLARLFGRKPAEQTDTIGQIRKQLESRFDPEQSRRLNKLLLARVFPEELRKARVNAVPLFTWRPVDRARRSVLDRALRGQRPGIGHHDRRRRRAVLRAGTGRGQGLSSRVTRPQYR